MILNISNLDYHQFPPKVIDTSNEGWHYLESVSEDKGYLCGSKHTDSIEFESIINDVHLIIIHVHGYESDGISIEYTINTVRLHTLSPILIAFDLTYRVTIHEMHNETYMRLHNILREDNVYLVCGFPQYQRYMALIGPIITLPSIRSYNVTSAKELIAEFNCERHFILVPYWELNHGGMETMEIAQTIADEIGALIIVIGGDSYEVAQRCGWHRAIYIKTVLSLKDFLILMKRSILCVNLWDSTGFGRVFAEAAIAETPVIHNGRTGIGYHLYPDTICSSMDFGATIDKALEAAKSDKIKEYAYNKIDDIGFEGIRTSLKKQLKLDYI